MHQLKWSSTDRILSCIFSSGGLWVQSPLPPSDVIADSVTATSVLEQNSGIATDEDDAVDSSALSDEDQRSSLDRL
jgi:hypothetical protein